MTVSIKFWWPTTGHPAWEDPTRTGREGWWLSETYHTVPFHKELILRHYRLQRKLGAPPIAARLSCMYAQQTQLKTEVGVTWRDGDETIATPGDPMAWFPAQGYCQHCGDELKESLAGPPASTLDGSLLCERLSNHFPHEYQLEPGDEGYDDDLEDFDE